MIPEYDPRNWFWFIGGDETQVYSSAVAAYVKTASADLSRVSRANTESDVFESLRRENVPPFHRVSVYRIVRRLEDAGLADAALAVIDAPANAVLKARFYGLAGMVETGAGVPADDPDAVSLVLAAGGDPAVILAPE